MLTTDGLDCLSELAQKFLEGPKLHPGGVDKFHENIFGDLSVIVSPRYRLEEIAKTAYVSNGCFKTFKCSRMCQMKQDGRIEILQFVSQSRYMYMSAMRMVKNAPLHGSSTFTAGFSKSYERTHSLRRLSTK